MFSFQNRYRLILFTCLKACMGGGPGGNPGKAWGAHIGGGSFWALDFWGLLWGCCLCRLGVVDLSLSSVDDSASFTLIAQTNSFRFGLLFSFFQWKGNCTLGGFLKWKKRRRKRRTDVQITLIYPYKKLGLWLLRLNLWIDDTVGHTFVSYYFIKIALVICIYFIVPQM